MYGMVFVIVLPVRSVAVTVNVWLPTVLVMICPPAQSGRGRIAAVAPSGA